MEMKKILSIIPIIMSFLLISLAIKAEAQEFDEIINGHPSLSSKADDLFMISEQGGVVQKQRYPRTSSSQLTIEFLKQKRTYQNLKNELGIDSDPFGNENDKKLIIRDSAGRFESDFDTDRYLIAEIQKIQTNSVVIMKITDGMWNWQYLIFLYFDNRLNYIDNIDFDFQKSGSPKIRFYNTDDSNLIFFAVNFDGGSGTGVYLISEKWYRLNRYGIELMFEYPGEGYVSGWVNFNREFDSEVAFNVLKKMVTIRFKVKYTMGYEEGDEVLFTVDKKAYYRWDSAMARFIFDSHRSGISQKAIDGIFNDSYDGMLENNFEELMKLAEKGNKKQKSWLKSFLKECSDNISKSRILKKLK